MARHSADRDEVVLANVDCYHFGHNALLQKTDARVFSTTTENAWRFDQVVSRLFYTLIEQTIVVKVGDLLVLFSLSLLLLLRPSISLFPLRILVVFNG